MFTLNANLAVYLHREAIDFRKSVNGLAALVEHELERDAFAAAAYVFGNRRKDRIKILGWFIALIAQLYAVESRARQCNLNAADRLCERQRHSVGVLQRIQALLLAHLHAVVPGSLLGKALHYLSSQ
jgi:hypothetical protein